MVAATLPFFSRDWCGAAVAFFPRHGSTYVFEHVGPQHVGSCTAGIVEVVLDSEGWRSSSELPSAVVMRAGFWGWGKREGCEAARQVVQAERGRQPGAQP